MNCGMRSRTWRSSCTSCAASETSSGDVVSTGFGSDIGFLLFDFDFHSLGLAPSGCAIDRKGEITQCKTRRVFVTFIYDGDHLVDIEGMNDIQNCTLDLMTGIDEIPAD